MKKITFLFIFICAFANGQNIKELYAEKFESDWKVYENENYVKKFIDTTVVYKLKSGRSPEQELLHKAKENLKKRTERISQIFSSLNVSLKEFDSLVFIEQRSTNVNLEYDFVKKGAIITKDSIYGFTYDLVKEDQGIKNYNYFKNSKNKSLAQAKLIIENLILSSKTNYLDSIAKVESEMLAGPLQNLRPEVEFEILIYNKKNKNELRRIYLHETFVRIINQK
jgi:hypothetical protein